MLARVIYGCLRGKRLGRVLIRCTAYPEDVKDRDSILKRHFSRHVDLRFRNVRKRGPTQPSLILHYERNARSRRSAWPDGYFVIADLVDCFSMKIRPYRRRRSPGFTRHPLEDSVKTIDLIVIQSILESAEIVGEENPGIPGGVYLKF